MFTGTNFSDTCHSELLLEMRKNVFDAGLPVVRMFLGHTVWSVNMQKSDISVLSHCRWYKIQVTVDLSTFINWVTNWAIFSSLLKGRAIVTVDIKMCCCLLKPPLSLLVSSELQLSVSHGSGRPGSGAVPAEREQGAEQEHVQLSLPGCYRQGWSAGWTHGGHNAQCAGR